MSTPKTQNSQTSKLNIHQRINLVMQDVSYVQKVRPKGMQYSVVMHDDVTRAIRGPFIKHGIVAYIVEVWRTQTGNRTELDLRMRFANIDDPTDFIDVESSGYGVDGQDKGPGKAMSYAVKYAYLKTLGLETGDETDRSSIDHDPSATSLTPKEIVIGLVREWSGVDNGDVASAVKTVVEASGITIGKNSLADDQWGTVKTWIKKNNKTDFAQATYRPNPSDSPPSQEELDAAMVSHDPSLY